MMGSMAIRVALVMVLASCGAVETDDPATPRVAQVVAPAGATEAIATIVDVMDITVDVVVHWTDDPIPSGDKLAAGLYAGCQDVWVRKTTTSPPYALSHELAHCALDTLTGDSDHDHLDAYWWGDYGMVHRAHVAAMRQALPRCADLDCDLLDQLSYSVDGHPVLKQFCVSFTDPSCEPNPQGCVPVFPGIECRTE